MNNTTTLQPDFCLLTEHVLKTDDLIKCYLCLLIGVIIAFSLLLITFARSLDNMEKHARDLQHGETQTIHELAQIGAQLRDLEEKITPKPKKENTRKPRYTRKDGQWVRQNAKPTYPDGKSVEWHGGDENVMIGNPNNVIPINGKDNPKKVIGQTNEILIGDQTYFHVEPKERSLYFGQPRFGFFMVKSQDKNKEPKEEEKKEEPEIETSNRKPVEKLVETPDNGAFEGHYEE